MKIDLKKIVGDFKTWVALGAILLAVASTIVTYANMPKKVEAVEKTANETAKKVEKLEPVPEKVEKLEDQAQQTDENVNKLAGTVDKYIAVQAEQQKSQEQREQLMLKLIEEVSKK